MDSTQNAFYANASDSRYSADFTAIDGISLTSTPFASSPNGDFYLIQDSNEDVVDNGYTFQDDTYSVEDLTTTAPTLQSTAIGSDTTWSKTSLDTGDPDLGFHYDRVDHAIGNSSANYQLTVNNSAVLTIQPGVVIAFWRDASDKYGNITIEGGAKVVAEGSADDPIVFQSIYATGDAIKIPYHPVSFYSSNYQSGLYLTPTAHTDSSIEYCHFRNADRGLSMQQTLSLPIRSCVFDNCYRGIANAHSSVQNSLFLDCTYAGILAYQNDSLTRNIVTGNFNNTFVRCNHAVLEKNDRTSSAHNRQDTFKNNLFTSSNHGVNLDGSSNEVQMTLDYNLYWNNLNDIAAAFSKGTSHIDAANGYLNAPLFVHQADTGPFLSTDGYFLAQNAADACRRPMRIDANRSIGFIDSPSGFQGNVFLEIYVGASDYAFPASSSYSYSCMYLVLTGLSYTGIEDAIGNLYVVISNSSAKYDWTSGANTHFDVVMENGSRLRIYFPSGIVVGEESAIAFWIAEDGSAYFAYSGHSARQVGDCPFDQDAWYAMAYDPESTDGADAGSYTGGLAISAYDARGAASEAVDFGAQGYFSEGSTSSAFLLSASDQFNDYYPVDLGFHYGEGVVNDPSPPGAGCSLDVTENSDYLHDLGDLIYNTTNGIGIVQFTLSGEFSDEANPWKVQFGPGFSSPGTTEDSDPSDGYSRDYHVMRDDEAEGIEVDFIDKAGNARAKVLTAIADMQGPTANFYQFLPARTYSTQSPVTFHVVIEDATAGVRSGELYADEDQDGIPDESEILDESALADRFDWTTPEDEGQYDIYATGVDNVSNAFVSDPHPVAVVDARSDLEYAKRFTQDYWVEMTDTGALRRSLDGNTFVPLPGGDFSSALDQCHAVPVDLEVVSVVSATSPVHVYPATACLMDNKGNVYLYDLTSEAPIGISTIPGDYLDVIDFEIGSRGIESEVYLLRAAHHGTIVDVTPQEDGPYFQFEGDAPWYSAYGADALNFELVEDATGFTDGLYAMTNGVGLGQGGGVVYRLSKNGSATVFEIVNGSPMDKAQGMSFAASPRSNLLLAYCDDNADGAGEMHYYNRKQDYQQTTDSSNALRNRWGSTPASAGSFSRS